jgi:NIMA (never in mitosis gene a)-related kinase
MSLNYKVINVLGEGSFGKAFLCKKLSDNSLCVIKQILIEGMSQKEKDEVLN